MNKLDISIEFIANATKYHQSILKGEHKVANRCTKNLNKFYLKLEKIDPLQLMENYLEHEDEGVQLWSATFVVKYNLEKGTKYLRKLSKLGSITGLTAQIILKSQFDHKKYPFKK